MSVCLISYCSKRARCIARISKLLCTSYESYSVWKYHKNIPCPKAVRLAEQEVSRTLPVAFLYRWVASLMRSLTSRFPSPHGTTTRTFPKHTVTFMFTTVYSTVVVTRSIMTPYLARAHLPTTTPRPHQQHCFTTSHLTLSALVRQRFSTCHTNHNKTYKHTLRLYMS